MTSSPAVALLLQTYTGLKMFRSAFSCTIWGRLHTILKSNQIMQCREYQRHIPLPLPQFFCNTCRKVPQTFNNVVQFMEGHVCPKMSSSWSGLEIILHNQDAYASSTSYTPLSTRSWNGTRQGGRGRQRGSGGKDVERAGVAHTPPYQLLRVPFSIWDHIPTACARSSFAC